MNRTFKRNFFSGAWDHGNCCYCFTVAIILVSFMTLSVDVGATHILYLARLGSTSYGNMKPRCVKFCVCKFFMFLWSRLTLEQLLLIVYFTCEWFNFASWMIQRKIAGPLFCFKNGLMKNIALLSGFAPSCYININILPLFADQNLPRKMLLKWVYCFQHVASFNIFVLYETGLFLFARFGSSWSWLTLSFLFSTFISTAQSL